MQNLERGKGERAAVVGKLPKGELVPGPDASRIAATLVLPLALCVPHQGGERWDKPDFPCGTWRLSSAGA